MPRVLKSSAGEPVKLWIARKEAFTNLYSRVKERRETFGKALNLNYWGLEQASGDPYAFRLHSVNWSWRYVQWLQSEFGSEKLYLRYPRGIGNDDAFAKVAEEAIGRTAEEAGIRRVLRDVIPELATFGCCAVHQGYHEEMVTAAQLDQLAKGAGQVLEDAVGGDTKAKPGQDHRRMAAALRFYIEEEDEEGARVREVPPQKRDMIYLRAQDHDRMAEDELDTRNEPFVTDRRPWLRLGRVGIDTFWNHECIDPGGEDYFIRQVNMPIDVVRANPFYRRSVVRELKGVDISDLTDEHKQRVNIGVKVDGLDGSADENKYVRVFFVEDKRFNKRLVYTDDGEGHYLLEGEDSEDFPHVDDEGKPLFPGFFSTKIIRPFLPTTFDPIRMFGVPMLSPMWSQQIEANRLSQFALEDVKRHTRTIIGYNAKIKDKSVLKGKLESGIPSIAFEMPHGVPGKEVVYPYQFTGDSSAVLMHLSQLKSEFVEISGMPRSRLTSVANAPTATQEEIGVETGDKQARYIISLIENDIGDLLRGFTAMLRENFDDADWAGILGDSFSDRIDLFVNSSLEGDKLEVRAGARARAAEAVEREQIMRAIEVARSEIEVATGLPRVETLPLIEDLFTKFDMKMTPVDPDLNQMRQQLQQALAILKQMREENDKLEDEVVALKRQAKVDKAPAGGQKSSSNGSSKKPAKRKSSGKAPRKSNLNSGARRGTAKASSS